MGFRSYDFECSECGEVRPDLHWVNYGESVPRTVSKQCRVCGSTNEHTRVISLVAEYHGERPLNPVVYGGGFDTAGFKPMPKSHLAEALPNLPKDAGPNERKERIDQYTERFRSKEWTDYKAQCADLTKQNRAKQQRLAAIQRGENINMRRDKLPGDPKVSA